MRKALPAATAGSLIALVLLTTPCGDWPLCEEPCATGNRCLRGACVPDPCQNKNCGDDGYGGTCGTCSLTQLCMEGRCFPENVPVNPPPCAACADRDPCCPEEMVQVGQSCLCIDRYEASPDEADQALSRPGVLPWTSITWVGAEQACQRAGKRLCTSAEWTQACIGTQQCLVICVHVFPYGGTFDDTRCNNKRKPPAESPTEPVPTGAMSRCTGGFPGLYDLSGNVAEWVDSCTSSSCVTKGGSFNDWDYSLSCDYESSESRGIREHDWYSDEGRKIGFRCCKTVSD